MVRDTRDGAMLERARAAARQPASQIGFSSAFSDQTARRQYARHWLRLPSTGFAHAVVKLLNTSLKTTGWGSCTARGSAGLSTVLPIC